MGANKPKNQKNFNAIKDNDIEHIEIPSEGFLGLLAYGDVGLIAWRKSRGLKIKSAAEIQEEKIRRNNEQANS